MSNVTIEHLERELRMIRETLERLEKLVAQVATGLSNVSDRMLQGERRLNDGGL